MMRSMPTPVSEILPPRTSSAHDRIIALGLALVVFAWHQWLGGFIDPQSTIDAQYYHIIAQRLLAGAGFSEPFIWQQLREYPSVVHAIDYWQPFGICLFAGAARLLGTAWGPTALNHILWGWLTSAVYRVARRQEAARPEALAGALLLGFGGKAAFYLSTTDNVAFYAVFGFIVFELVMADNLDGRHAAGIGAVTALMTLTRAEGPLFLVLALAATLGRAGKPWRFAMGAVVAFALVLSPWIIRNQLELGRPWPDQHRALFMKQYNEMFDGDRRPTLDTLCEHGLTPVILAKATAWRHLFAEFFLLPAALIPVVWLFAGLWTQPPRRARTLLLALIACWVVSGWVFTTQSARGTAFHMVAALLPHCALCVIHGIAAGCGAWERWRGLAPRALVTGMAALTAVWCLVFSLATTLHHRDLYAGETGRYRTILTGMTSASASVVLSFEPIPVAHFSGCRGVVLPVATLTRVLPLARRHQASHILFDAHLVPGLASDSFAPWYVPIASAQGLTLFTRSATAW